MVGWSDVRTHRHTCNTDVVSVAIQYKKCRSKDLKQDGKASAQDSLQHALEQYSRSTAKCVMPSPDMAIVDTERLLDGVVYRNSI